MRKQLGVLAIAAVALTLVAVGCGGDDDDGDAPTKEEFITQADDICRQGDQEINQAANETFGGGGQPSSSEQEEFVTETVLPNIQNQVDGIRELTPPEGDEDEVNAILDAAQSGIDEGEQDPSSFTQGGGGNPLTEANKLAEDYGLTACGGG